MRRTRGWFGGAALLLASWIPAAGPAVADPLDRNRERYLLHCSGCHGADGSGVPGTTPSLRTLGRLLEREGGRAYLARVPGVAQAPLPDDELASLLNWVLREIAGAPVSPPYSSAEIGRLRAEPLRDTVTARAQLLAH